MLIFFCFQKTTSAGFRLAKAHTVLRVVTAQPEKHGGDLLKITSGLLTEALAGMTIDHQCTDILFSMEYFGNLIPFKYLISAFFQISLKLHSA